MKNMEFDAMKSRRARAIDIDDVSAYRALDADGMLDRLHEFPGECQRAWDMATGFDLPESFSAADKVVVLGMGGSAIGGDLVASLATSESRATVAVHRGYDLPAFVDRRTLVVASSYSGNTEETLTAFEQAMKSGALTLAITTGGKLKEIAEASNVPTFVFDYKSPPRAALPYSFMTLLCFLGRLGLLHDRSADVGKMISILRQRAAALKEEVPLRSNQAKQIASDLAGHLAVIYGGEALSEVAHRWKTQINENSKGWAFYELFPEMNHNSVVGYEFPPKLNAQIHVVMLASSFLSPRVQLRYEVAGRLLKRAGVSFQTVYGSGEDLLSDMMSLVLLGDYVSYYLALLNGTAPGPVHAIDYLKNELANASDR